MIELAELLEAWASLLLIAGNFLATFPRPSHRDSKTETPFSLEKN